MNAFQINQIFTEIYPPEAAEWCNNNHATIVKVDGGYKIVAIPEPTRDELSAQLRTERDRRITSCDWIISRHAEELAMALDTTLTEFQYSEWLSYRQSLRDLTDADGFPWDGGSAQTPWPVAPEM